MSDLSEAARELIRDGQSILRPSLDDRARVASALASRLPEGALVASTTAGAAAGRWLVWQKVTGLVVGVGLVGASATWALRPSEDVTPAAAAGRAAVPMTAETPAQLPLPEPVEAPPVPSSPSPSDVAVPTKPAAAVDRLAEEVSILSKATGQLRSGKPGEALRLLNEHQRRFPGGRLVEERRAARIQALCALGNRGAAEAELAQLARSSPRSPHLARARQACGL